MNGLSEGMLYGGPLSLSSISTRSTLPRSADLSNTVDERVRRIQSFIFLYNLDVTPHAVPSPSSSCLLHLPPKNFFFNEISYKCSADHSSSYSISPSTNILSLAYCPLYLYLPLCPTISAKNLCKFVLFLFS